MNIQLSDHFNIQRLIRFTLPTIGMMVFSSVYGVVDGLCVSNWIGEEALAAVNIVMPFPLMCSALGLMFGSGGAAYLSRTLGHGDVRRANAILSLVVISAIIVGLVATVSGYIYMPQIASALGADSVLSPICVAYGRVYMLAMIPYILQNVFQSLLVTASKPRLALRITLIAGFTNIFLDILLVGFAGFGVTGAAWATFVSCLIGGVVPLVYLMSPNGSLLRMSRPILDFRALRSICFNGSSEMVTEMAVPLCSVLYNLRLMGMVGQDGVAAYGTITYVSYIFVAAMLGYFTGLENIIGYHFGAENFAEVQNLRRKSLKLMAYFGVITFSCAWIAAPWLSGLFVGYNEQLAALTTHGFRLFSLAFLIMGINAFTSSLFTAVGNGLISATISFCRTFLFQAFAVAVVPLLLGLDGVWLSMFVAEFFCLAVSAFFYWRYKSIYRY